MGKYNQETKDTCVSMVKEGKSFKEIQQTVGPNPKAVMRYLKSAGIDYKALREELKEAGIIKKPEVNTQKPKKAKKAKEAKAEVEVIEE